MALGVHAGLSLYNLTHLAYKLFLLTTSQLFNFLLFFVITIPISPHSQGYLHCITLCLHSSMSLFILELKTIESDSTIMYVIPINKSLISIRQWLFSHYSILTTAEISENKLNTRQSSTLSSIYKIRGFLPAMKKCSGL